MSSIVELPIRLEESDKLASLDDVLGTLKVVYTTTACSQCGRMVTLTEITTPRVRDAALVCFFRHRSSSGAGTLSGRPPGSVREIDR
ncbi:MAG: hypothetical protein JO352_34460 [Chloroflexi bacterium]|nr:hypothetical protein [Chloroflexota bacterium]MBV9599426.1 hypothetical protein [Chloroflexota bacterium]